MNHIQDLEYKGHDIVIIQDNDKFIADIRVDDYDGHMMQGYGNLGSQSEAVSVAKAFIDGLYHVEETDTQHRGQA